MSEQSWRDVFVGRNIEMNLLQDAWSKARLNEPQFVILLAETGVGKTRLIQEFYTWLSNDENDPNNYWAESLGCKNGLQISKSLNVNPEGSYGNGEISWLWWGLRLSRPIRNQQVNKCAISDAYAELKGHAHVIDMTRRRKDLGKSVFAGTIKVISGLLAKVSGFELIETAVETCTSAGDLMEQDKNYKTEKSRKMEDKILSEK